MLVLARQEAGPVLEVVQLLVGDDVVKVDDLVLAREDVVPTGDLTHVFVAVLLAHDEHAEPDALLRLLPRPHRDADGLENALGDLDAGRPVDGQAFLEPDALGVRVDDLEESWEKARYERIECVVREALSIMHERVRYFRVGNIVTIKFLKVTRCRTIEQIACVA